MAPNDIYCRAIYKTCKSEQRGHHHPNMPGITFLKCFLPNFPIKVALWTNAKHIIITVALTRPSVRIKWPINDFYLDFIIQFYLCLGIYLEWLSGHFNSSSMLYIFEVGYINIYSMYRGWLSYLVTVRRYRGWLMHSIVAVM